MFFSTNCFRDFLGQDAFLIFIENHFTTNVIGGPIEDIGRLKYIDGCTDSILLPPIIKGAPCLNALFFPKGTNQTYHTHPSFRLGMVIKGKGTCELKDRCIDLIPGKVFMIPQDFLHRFQTNDDELVVVAFHPDSDFGPENLDHPMINKTVVEGISANKIKDIRCALCHSVETAKMARNHNNANVLALGGRILDEDNAKTILDTFLAEKFEGGRHQKRIDKI